MKGMGHYPPLSGTQNSESGSCLQCNLTHRKTVKFILQSLSMHHFRHAPQSYAIPFTDTTPVYNAEVWDPATQAFTVLAGASIPRNYHSISLLLPDARIFNGGAGLCGVGCPCASGCY